MEGERTPTIIQLILSMDLAVIQLKYSHLIFHISQHFLHYTSYYVAYFSFYIILVYFILFYFDLFSFLLEREAVACP